MAKKSKTSPTLNEMLKQVISLLDESDRGYAIIIAAWIDDSLAHLIRSAMVHDLKACDELLQSALRNSSARINLAYCLGLIDCRIKEDLRRIYTIRNHFAHSRNMINFDDSDISTCVQKLQLIDIVPISIDGADRQVFSNRQVFVRVTSFVLMYLIERSKHVPKICSDPEKSLDQYVLQQKKKLPQVRLLLDKVSRWQIEKEKAIK